MPKWAAQASASRGGVATPSGQPKAVPGAKLVEEVLRQRGIAAEVRVLGVVEQPVVEDAVGAGCLQHLGTVDQEDGGVPRG